MPRNRSQNRSRTLAGLDQVPLQSKSRGHEDPPGTQPPGVMRRYNATIQNPDASDEAKQHAQDQLDKYLAKYESTQGGSQG